MLHTSLSVPCLCQHPAERRREPRGQGLEVPIDSILENRPQMRIRGGVLLDPVEAVRRKLAPDGGDDLQQETHGLLRRRRLEEDLKGDGPHARVITLDVPANAVLYRAL